MPYLIEFSICNACAATSPFVLLPGPSESFTAVLKAYQNLEPGDFTGFLKLLKSPASYRLQSHCTNFLDTMENYHVITSALFIYFYTSTTAIILLWCVRAIQITVATFTGYACTEAV